MRKNVSKAGVVAIMGMVIGLLAPGSGSVVTAYTPGTGTEGWFWIATECTQGCDWDDPAN